MELWSSINRIMELQKIIIVPLNFIELGRFKIQFRYFYRWFSFPHISTSIMERHNWFMENHSLLMELHVWLMDFHNSIGGAAYLGLWSSIIRFMCYVYS